MKFILLAFLLMGVLGCSDSKNRASGLNDHQLKLSGDWESSGGDGVICFDSVESKNKNKELLKTPEKFNKILKQQIVSLNSLEYYEFLSSSSDSKFSLWTKLKPQSDYRSILNQVLDRLRFYSPVMAQKLDLVLEHIQVNEWIPSQSITEIQDSKPHRSIDLECELIQLADRQTQSSEGYLPKAKVFFRQDLFNSLDELNKSILVLHEALYLIGRETNHTNSDDIRLINTLLFSEQFEIEFNTDNYFSRQAKNVQGLFIHYFGDYIRFFIKEDFYLNPKDYSEIKYNNNYTRSVSMIQMNFEMRNYMGECNQNLSPPECQDKLMLGPDLKKIVNTEEKAFLFLMNYFFDNRGLLTTSTEHLYVLDFKDPLKQDENVQFQLGSACGQILGAIEVQMGGESLALDQEGLPLLEGDEALRIQNHFKETMWFKDFALPTLRYCKEIRKALRE